MSGPVSWVNIIAYHLWVRQRFRVLVLFSTAAYEAVYFPMVIVFYAPLAWWFVKRLSDDPEATARKRVGTDPD